MPETYEDFNSSDDLECWDEDTWGEMTEEDWEEIFNDKYHEGCGGD